MKNFSVSLFCTLYTIGYFSQTLAADKASATNHPAYQDWFLLNQSSSDDPLLCTKVEIKDHKQVYSTDGRPLVYTKIESDDKKDVILVKVYKSQNFKDLWTTEYLIKLSSEDMPLFFSTTGNNPHFQDISFEDKKNKTIDLFVDSNNHRGKLKLVDHINKKKTHWTFSLKGFNEAFDALQKTQKEFEQQQEK